MEFSSEVFSSFLDEDVTLYDILFDLRAIAREIGRNDRRMWLS